MSSTEYLLSRRRARTQDGADGEGETGAGAGEAGDSVPRDRREDPTAPARFGGGSQRLGSRVAVPEVWAPPPIVREVAPPPVIDLDWSAFEDETAEIEAPAGLAIAAPAIAPAMTRTKTEPMPAAELAVALAGMSDASVPVTSVRFGDQQILIVHRGPHVDLVLPGGQRITGHRDNAAALARALVRTTDR